MLIAVSIQIHVCIAYLSGGGGERAELSKSQKYIKTIRKPDSVKIDSPPFSIQQYTS